MSKSDTKPITIFTIGYAGKDARRFFEILRQTGIKKVIDVRLYNTSQLAGFTKMRDLEYFLRSIVGIQYLHLSIMAPTPRLLNDYKKGLIDWPQYEKQFNLIISQRQIEKHIDPAQIDMACFLCSESKPDNCHRRLVAEYLANHWKNIVIHHL